MKTKSYGLIDTCTALDELHKETVFVLFVQPVMILVGYPVGFMVLKSLSMGLIDLAPWDNYGEPYRLTMQRVFKKSKTRKHTINTESVALIGWNVATAIVIAAIVFANVN